MDELVDRQDVSGYDAPPGRSSRTNAPIRPRALMAELH